MHGVKQQPQLTESSLTQLSIEDLMTQMESLSLVQKDQNGNIHLNQTSFASGPSTCSSGYEPHLVMDIDDDMDSSDDDCVKPERKLSKEEYMQKLMLEYYKRTILKSNDLNVSYYNKCLQQKYSNDL